MARPKKTTAQYLKQYSGALKEIELGTSLRKVARDQKIGLSTCVRLKKKFF